MASLELLLDVMAKDAPSVSQRIQHVLLSSYYPNVEEGAVRGLPSMLSISQACPKKNLEALRYLKTIPTAALKLSAKPNLDDECKSTLLNP